MISNAAHDRTTLWAILAVVLAVPVLNRPAWSIRTLVGEPRHLDLAALVILVLLPKHVTFLSFLFFRSQTLDFVSQFSVWLYPWGTISATMFGAISFQD